MDLDGAGKESTKELISGEEGSGESTEAAMGGEGVERVKSPTSPAREPRGLNDGEGEGSAMTTAAVSRWELTRLRVAEGGRIREGEGACRSRIGLFPSKI